MKRFLPLLLPIIFLAACDTEPAKDVTEHEATLTAKGRCEEVPTYPYHVDWWYELREVGGEFARVGPVNSFDCASASGELPLPEHPATGLDSGTTYEYRVAWRVNDGAVFYADRNGIDGTDWERFTTDYQFSAPGPCQVEVIPDSFAYTSSFDGQRYSSLIRLYKPVGGPSGPRPVLLFHRGTTFTHTEYGDILSRVASHCFVVASVQDPTAFGGGEGDPAPDGFYNYDRPDAGMEFACSALEGATKHLRDSNRKPSHPLYRRLDLNRVFMAGHSRGGGAAQACHARGYELDLRGVVIWMGFDLRYFIETVPPGVDSAYGIPDAAPSIPSLVLAAQKDGDRGYPIADQFFERMTGPATSVVMYGAIHNYAADDPRPAETQPGITREEQHDLMVAWTTAFLKRWGDDDLSVDGLLYGNEASASQSVAVIGQGNYAGSVVIDDFQDADPPHNRLGGENTLAGASSTEESFYPTMGTAECGACGTPGTIGPYSLCCVPSFGTLPIRNKVIALSDTSTIAEYATQVPVGALPPTAHRLIFRMSVQLNRSFSLFRLYAQLTDHDGHVVTVNLSDPTAPGGPYLPSDGVHPHDRFVQVEIPIAQIPVGAFQLGRLKEIKLDFVPVAPYLWKVALDDLRVE